jgi:hypothetical protein
MLFSYNDIPSITPTQKQGTTVFTEYFKLSVTDEDKNNDKEIERCNKIMCS